MQMIINFGCKLELTEEELLVEVNSYLWRHNIADKYENLSDVSEDLLYDAVTDSGKVYDDLLENLEDKGNYLITK